MFRLALMSRSISSRHNLVSGYPMSHNGYNTYQKVHLGEANVGKYLCGVCGKSIQEDRDFWIKLKAGFFEIILSEFGLIHERAKHVLFIILLLPIFID